MKKINLILLILLLFAGKSFGQTAHNPFTQNIHFMPEPTVSGFECGSTQTVVFTQGLTTASNAALWQTEPLVVTICLSGFTYSGPASSVVSGAYSTNFNWAYDPFSANCIIGTQNQPLIGTGGNPLFPDPLSSGEIKLTLSVPETSPLGTILSVNVNLIVPPYIAIFNSIPDDDEATQTQSFCPLKIRGTVYNDKDSNLNVNGIPISVPDGSQLYASLIGPNSDVLATTPIAANGTYEFQNVAPNTIYTVVVGNVPGIVGNPSPGTLLPGTWTHTGEDCCDALGNDGTADGITVVDITNFSRFNVDFGIKELIKISGTVYNDTIADNNVNGNVIQKPADTLLYVSLVDENGNVEAVTPVAIDGTYEFLNVTPFTNYTIVLSITPGIIGSLPPASNLPGTWVNTGEDCCDQIGTDGNDDGINIVPVTDFSKTHADFGIRNPSATGFPLVLKNFFVSEYNCSGLLSWTTLQEENTSHVDIYRKEAGQAAFSKIATVQSAGISSEEKIYSYIDADVTANGLYEYQLKFVDIDGQFTKSSIKSLNLDCSRQSTSMNIFPNPANGELNILYVTEADETELNLEIIDITGRTILEKTQVVKNGGTVITLNIESLAVGAYVLHYNDMDASTTGSVKFTKQ